MLHDILIAFINSLVVFSFPVIMFIVWRNLLRKFN